MPHLLIIDSDLEVGDATRDMLRLKGHEVATTRSIGDALAILARQRFDVIFTNLNTPGRQGASFVSAARALQPGVGLVSTTGASTRSDGGEFDALLPKPFSLDEVETAIRLVLERSR